MFFSIIVPVYNAEKYLERCLESILHQSFTDYEVILVDDGTKDKSGELCDAFAEKDARVCAIHKSNGGASSARNVGVEKAQGEYLLFVDSDDTIFNGALQKLADQIKEKEEADVFIVQHAVNGDAQKDRLNMQAKQVITGEQMLLQLYEEKKLFVPPWKYCVKTSYIKRIGLEFYEGIVNEDEIWSLWLILQSQKVCFFDIVVCDYIVHENSVSTAMADEKRGKAFLVLAIEKERMLREIDLKDAEIKKRLKDSMISAYLKGCIFSLYGQNRDEQLKMMEEHSYFIKQIRSWKHVKLFMKAWYLYIRIGKTKR